MAELIPPAVTLGGGDGALESRLQSILRRLGGGGLADPGGTERLALGLGHERHPDAPLGSAPEPSRVAWLDRQPTAMQG